MFFAGAMVVAGHIIYLTLVKFPIGFKDEEEEEQPTTKSGNKNTGRF